MNIIIDFKEEFLQNTKYFKLLLGHQMKKYWPSFLFFEIIRGNKIGVWKCLYKLLQTFKKSYKNLIFQTIVKLINIYGIIKFQTILRSRGAKGAQKVDIKKILRKSFTKNIKFQTIVGASKKQISGYIFMLWFDQGLKMSVFVKPLQIF